MSCGRRITGGGLGLRAAATGAFFGFGLGFGVTFGLTVGAATIVVRVVVLVEDVGAGAGGGGGVTTARGGGVVRVAGFGAGLGLGAGCAGVAASGGSGVGASGVGVTAAGLVVALVFGVVCEPGFVVGGGAFVGVPSAGARRRVAPGPMVVRRAPATASRRPRARYRPERTQRRSSPQRGLRVYAAAAETSSFETPVPSLSPCTVRRFGSLVNTR